MHYMTQIPGQWRRRLHGYIYFPSELGETRYVRWALDKVSGVGHGRQDAEYLLIQAETETGLNNNPVINPVRVRV